MVKLPESYGTGTWELFNLNNHPGETTDLMQEYPNKTAELLAAWNDYINKNNVVMESESSGY